MLGRRPQAQELQRLKGAFEKNPNRENKDAPSPDGLEPPMPDYFDEDETLKWLELVQDMRGLGVLSSDMREILIAYCTSFGGWIKARRMVAKTGLALMQKDNEGRLDIKRNAWSVELHRYRDEMNRLLPEFGLTPSSRQRLVSLKPVEDDPFLELLNRRSVPRN